MLKKTLSIILSVALITSSYNFSALAYAPTNYKNPKCIDLSNLNEKRYTSKEKNACGCKDCSIEALTYDKLEDYLSNVEQKINEIAKEKPTLKKEMQQKNIYFELRHLNNQIEDKRYEGRNFILVSKNNSPDKRDVVAQFARKDGITYNGAEFGEKYFNDINENKIKPLIDTVKQKFENYKNQTNEFKYNILEKISFGFFSTIILLDVALCISELSKMIFDVIKDNYTEITEKRKLNKLIRLIDALPEQEQEIYLKKICNISTEDLKLTKESFKKLSPETIDELLKELQTSKEK